MTVATGSELGRTAAPDRAKSWGRRTVQRLRRERDRARTSLGGRPWRVSDRFSSSIHDEWVASWLGIALGVTFTVCFLTGLVDYLAQHPPSWFHLPTRPVYLFRVTQGVHVVTGIASIPLVLAKLWTTWPRLFEWPPVRSALHALERLSLVPLVGGSLFLLFTGVLNIDYWYSPMPFYFPAAHFWTAWIVVGALVIHVACKAATASHALRAGPGGERDGPTPAVAGREGVGAIDPLGQPPGPGTAHVNGPGAGRRSPPGGLTRRGFLATVAGAAGVLVVTVAGETVRPLRKLALLAPRNPVVGPQGVPVNRSAAAARVVGAATDPSFRLAVSGRCARPRSFTLDQLRALPQRDAGLPIACVEGWSASASWRGVRLAQVLELVGAPADASVRVESLETIGLYRSSIVDPEHAQDPDTILALELNGQVLDLDHGYPVRLIAADRPGVLQTKWVGTVVVL